MIERRLGPNDLRLAAAGSNLQPGEIEFYQAIQPPLASALYRMNATQSVQLKAEAPRYDASQQFQIDAPRFRLEPGDVQQVFPPANLEGDYKYQLPHVVLRDRTLPWVRSIDGSIPSGKEVPVTWLALLLVTADELAGQSAKQMTLEQLLTPAAGIQVPAIDKSQFTRAQLDALLLAIDIPQPLFVKITPTLKDLPFLAHARQVNTDGKEILGTVADGYFSVVIGNRLPKPDAENLVMLVSVEGHQAHLRPAAPASGFVRVAMLASWSFRARVARGDFLQILSAVSIDLMRLPHTAFTSPTPDEQKAATALDIGYVPLLNNTRSGEETTSWYRGPGAAAAAAEDMGGPYVNADHVIRYDSGPDADSTDDSTPGTGLFDLSYACAWQIGRLLGLADAAFARALFDWRRSQHEQVNEAVALADLRDRLLKVGAAPHLLDAALHSLNDARGAMAHFWVGASEAMEAAPRIVLHEHRSDAALPGMVDEEVLQAAAEAGEDPLFTLLRHAFGDHEGGAR